jgi:hypothetical protein
VMKSWCMWIAFQKKLLALLLLELSRSEPA